MTYADHHPQYDPAQRRSGSTGDMADCPQLPRLLENLYIHHNYAEKIGQSANGGAVNVNDNVTSALPDHRQHRPVGCGSQGWRNLASMSAILVVSNSTIANNQAIGLPATGGAGFPTMEAGAVFTLSAA